MKMPNKTGVAKMERPSLKTRIKIVLLTTLITIILIGLQFIMPWFSDTYLVYLDIGLDVLVGYSTPLGIAIIIALCLKRLAGLKIPTLKPEISIISPMLIVFGVLLILAAQMVVRPILDILPVEFMEQYTADLINPMQAGFWPMVTVMIVVPVLSAWLFRGIIQTNIAACFGIFPAIIVSSLIYGLMHIMPQQVVSTFAAAFVMGAIYFLTRSLTTVIAVHMLFNGLEYLIFLMFGSAEELREVLIENLTVYVGVWTLSALLIAITAWWVYNHNENLKIKKYHMHTPNFLHHRKGKQPQN